MPTSESSRALRAISRMPSSDLSLLLQVSRALAASLDLEDVLQTAIESAVRALGLDTGAIYLLEGGDLILGATTPPLPPAFPEEFRREPLDRHPHVGRCLGEREPVALDDWTPAGMTEAERAVCEARGLRSILFVPLTVAEEAVGAFIVGSVGAVRTFAEKDVHLCRALSHEIGLALANARLYESLQRSHEELARAYDATIEGWSLALEMRDDETQGHALRVADLAVELGRAVGMPGRGPRSPAPRRAPPRHREDGRPRRDPPQGRAPRPRRSGRSCGGTRRTGGTSSGRSPTSSRRSTSRTPPRALGRDGLSPRPPGRGDPARGPRLRRGGRLRRPHLRPPLPGRLARGGRPRAPSALAPETSSTRGSWRCSWPGAPGRGRPGARRAPGTARPRSFSGGRARRRPARALPRRRRRARRRPSPAGRPGRGGGAAPCVTRIDLTSCGRRAGFASSICAASDETIGAAKLVPSTCL